MHNIDTKTSHITPAGGNVFLDLGFEPREAAALKEKSKKIIDKKLLGQCCPEMRVLTHGNSLNTIY